MLKKTLIGVGIIIAIIFIVSFLQNNDSSYDTVLLEKDEFSSFFPRQFNLSQNVRIMDLFTASMDGPIYIEKAVDKSIIKAGKQNNQSEIVVLESRRGIYRVPGKDPVFKVWVERVSPDYFNVYKEKSWEEINSYNDNVVLKKRYKSHDYYISHRKDLSNENLKNKNSIGSEYLFFPEKNIVVFIYFFNTKFQGCLDGNRETCKFHETEKILNEFDFAKIAETIIDANIN